MTRFLLFYLSSQKIIKVPPRFFIKKFLIHMWCWAVSLLPSLAPRSPYGKGLVPFILCLTAPSSALHLCAPCFPRVDLRVGRERFLLPLSLPNSLSEHDPCRSVFLTLRISYITCLSLVPACA